MQDEGLHEIQLNGKQLVFLFMAATVVAVVIFLCGVMVGRGVPAPSGAVLAEAGTTNADPTALAQQSSSVPVTDSDNRPVAADETLTYPERLEDANPVAETLKPTAEPAPRETIPRPVAESAVAKAPAAPPAPTVAKAPAQAPVPAPAKAVAAKPPVAVNATAGVVTPPTVAPVKAVAPKAPVAITESASAGEPGGKGFVVQVAAVRTRPDADAMARRLTAKGYPAFVTTSGGNFRVRVGKYDDRRQAESIAGRLEREEQFKPWITK
jgi:cell division septation protein DedD